MDETIAGATNPYGAPAGPEADSNLNPTVLRVVAAIAALGMALVLADWRTERFSSPDQVEKITDYSTFGHPAFQRPALDGRVHWASTETSPVAAGLIEGALAAAERAAAHIIDVDDSEADPHHPAGASA